MSENETDDNSIYESIYDYVNSLGISDKLMVNQIKRRVLNIVDDDTADVTITPSANIMVTSNQVIRPNSIKVNGVIYYERSN